VSRVVLITGGAGGIGRATGERFAAAGDTVVYADRSAEALASFAQPSDMVVADVTVVADCERMVAETSNVTAGWTSSSTAPASGWRDRPPR
jgi:NAD(P)-dependent dehydrogenase (short-subunit alcohol dehydrogenase family)